MPGITGTCTASVQVFRSDERAEADPLATTQQIQSADSPIWKLKLTKGELIDRDAPQLLKDNPPRFFFLTREAAVEYIEGLERLVVAEVIAKAEAQKEAN